MEPACYGNYSAHRSAPCGRCALRGPCSARTGEPVCGFVVLHHPRFTPPKPTDRVLAVTVEDPAPFAERLKLAGMTRHKGWWCVRGRLVAMLESCAVGRVVVRFADLHPASVASLPAASRAQVFPVFEDEKPRKLGTLRLSDARARRKEAFGSTAVLGNPAEAAELVVSAAVACY